MNIYLIIAKSTIKMYFRRTQSLFWTLFFPVVMMLGIGFFGFGQFIPPKLGIINYSNNYESDLFLEELNKKKYIETKIITENEIEKSILEGKIDSVMTISKDFTLESPNIEILFENSKEKIAQEFYDLSEMTISKLLSNSQNEKRIELLLRWINKIMKIFLLSFVQKTTTRHEQRAN